MKKIGINSKLQLRKETLRQIAREDLAAVNGGTLVQTAYCNLNTGQCIGAIPPKATQAIYSCLMAACTPTMLTCVTVC
jgi:hypothetical protein